MWLFKQNIYKTTSGIVAALYNQILCHIQTIRLTLATCQEAHIKYLTPL
jgi:hypothetical protein